TVSSMRPIEDEATEDILPAVLAAASRSPDKLRDTALVLVVMGTSLAPIEIALLRVDDFLNADSSIKHRSVVRAEIALNRKERPLHWVNARICKSISRYLSWRVQHGFDVTGRAEFRGLNPDSALFLTTTGLPMKVRERPSPRGAHRICATIQSIFHRLFLDANVAVTARDGRRRFAERLYTMGGDVEEIRTHLGVRYMREVWQLIGPAARQHAKGDRITHLLQQLI
ncbi:MAG TPA: site-specific integrase, partial [Burkholderiaceae bacterium]|nr:site-specific integrase [Burkholderiaceae bacterium]